MILITKSNPHAIKLIKEQYSFLFPITGLHLFYSHRKITGSVKAYGIGRPVQPVLNQLYGLLSCYIAFVK